MTDENKNDDENIPMWIRIFGGSILSITVLSVLTLTGYIVTNINSLQIQVNEINSEKITKQDFEERHKNFWASMKTDADVLSSMKEKISLIDQNNKDKQSLIEKLESKNGEQNKTIESLNKEIISLKEKNNGLDIQIMQIREEHRKTLENIQQIRERIAAVESKKN